MTDQPEETYSIEIQFDPSKLTPDVIRQIADVVVADLAQYQASTAQVAEDDVTQFNGIESFRRLPIPVPIPLPDFGKAFSKSGGHNKTHTKFGF